MDEVTRGLVLREVNYKEGDKILTVLLEGGGKRTVKAPGCRRKNSPLAAGAQLLVWSDMTLHDYRDRSTLKEAATLNEFRGMRADLDKLALGSYFAEVCEAVAEEGVDTPGLLSLVLNSLYALDKLPRPPELIKGAFEGRLCCVEGYEPQVERCALCGSAEPEQPRLSLNEGVLHCARCRERLHTVGISMPLDGPSLAAVRHVVYGEPKRLFSFQLPPESLRRFSDAMESFLLTQLERGFRTLDFYKQLSRLSLSGGEGWSGNI